MLAFSPAKKSRDGSYTCLASFGGEGGSIKHLGEGLRLLGTMEAMEAYDILTDSDVLATGGRRRSIFFLGRHRTHPWQVSIDDAFRAVLSLIDELDEVIHI